MIADSHAGQARVPHAVRRLLLDALALRDAHPDALHGRERDVIDSTAIEIDELDRHSTCAATAPQQLALPAPASPCRPAASDAITAAGAAPSDATLNDHDLPATLTAGRALLQARLDKLLEGHPTHDPNRKLLKHLQTEREHLFTFLDIPGVQATNWRAEQAIRPAVVNRKQWGGNRTWHGADTAQVLMSVIRTARQQDTDPVALLADLLHQPIPGPSPALTIPTPVRQHPATGDQPKPARGP
jgi:hypothetical protein